MKFGHFQVFLLSITVALAARNPDEDHPYEFGFTIDGQQHRHEKKDDKGIIQGEFGFITADGIYHVTVYATDENGDFKILSMRNLRISAPLDGSPFKGQISPEANKYRKQANLAPLPAPNALSLPENVVVSTTTVRPELVSTIKTVGKFTTQATVRPACASCGLITTPKPFVYQNVEAISNGQNNVPGTISPGEDPSLQNVQQAQTGGVNKINSAPTAGKVPPAYQAVSGPQSTNYNKFGSQEQEGVGGGQSLNTGNSHSAYEPANDLTLIPAAGAPNTQPDNVESQKPAGQYANQYSPGSEFNKPGVGHFEETGQNGSSGQNSQSPYQSANNPNSQNGNTDNLGNEAISVLDVGHSEQTGQNPNHGGQFGQGPNSGNSQSPYESTVSINGGASNTPTGNTGNLERNPSSPVSEFNHPGLINGAQQEQIGHAGPGSQQGGISHSTPALVPEPNPLQLPGGQGANPLSTLPPISVSDGFIHVGGDRKQDIPIKDKFPGMEDGLPAGIDEKDISNLLYKFHYTVGFHGHYEKGLKNGAKIGGYFVNGRDGISRVVTYIADENGYRPKVKFINLGLESDDTPKPETEKTFGLKSFEFVWYPL